MMREKIAVALLGLMTFGAAGVHAVAIPLSDTGAGLTDGSTDPNYTIPTNPDLTGIAAIVEDSSAFPIVSGPWIADTAGSRWIGPRFNTAPSAAGLYDYVTTFTLPANADLTTATLSGTWSFDDGGTGGTGVEGVYLNGTKLVGPPTGFTTLDPFSATGVAGGFLVGANTLTFIGNNGGSYTGLLTRGLSGSYSLTPEPASMSLLGLGGLSLLARRRRA